MPFVSKEVLVAFTEFHNLPLGNSSVWLGIFLNLMSNRLVTTAIEHANSNFSLGLFSKILL